MSLPGTAGLAPALAAAAALAVPAGPAGADIDCSFETECLEGETCADSGFEVTLETALSPGTILAEGGFPEGDRVVTDTATAEIRWAAAGPALAAFWVTQAGFHLLSFDDGGSARYSAHLPGAGLSVLYLGTCGTR